MSAERVCESADKHHYVSALWQRLVDLLPIFLEPPDTPAPDGAPTCTAGRHVTSGRRLMGSFGETCQWRRNPPPPFFSSAAVI